MSEIRYNRVEDTYVIIAPERLHRPDYMAWRKEDGSVGSCPFCEGNEEMTPSEIYAIRDNGTFADERGWSTRVVANLYKAVQIEAEHTSKIKGSNISWDGFGAHEVIIDTPRHLSTMSEWKSDTFFNWLKTISARVSDLRKDSRISYISIFKNHGTFAGASQSHPHTQLIALHIIPTSVQRKYERINAHYLSSGRVLMDEIIDEETKEKERVIMQSDSFIAFCPYASEYPFEVLITSQTIKPDIDMIGDDELQELSALLEDLFKRMEIQLGNFDFNLSISIPPIHNSYEIDKVCRFTVRIMPRIYRHAGFELSSGTMINPVRPEKSAALLREKSDEK